MTNSHKNIINPFLESSTLLIMTFPEIVESKDLLCGRTCAVDNVRARRKGVLGKLYEIQISTWKGVFAIPWNFPAILAWNMFRPWNMGKKLLEIWWFFPWSLGSSQLATWSSGYSRPAHAPRPATLCFLRCCCTLTAWRRMLSTRWWHAMCCKWQETGLNCLVSGWILWLMVDICRIM